MDSRETLQAALDEAGSWAELSRRSGVSSSTLKTRGSRLGVSIGSEKRTAILPGTDDTLRHEITELRKRVRRAERGEHEAELVMRRIEKAVEDNRPRFEPVEFEPHRKGDFTPQEMVLLFSDTHASEIVRPEGVRGLNEYDWETMLKRMSMITKALVSHAQHFQFRISRLRVLMLGDMLSGDIHDELAITNDRPTTEAVVDFAYDTVSWLQDLLEKLSEASVLVEGVSIAGVPGNHPRTSRKPSFKQAHANSDWVYYKLVEALLRDHPQFDTSFPMSRDHQIMLCGRWRALLMHGDGIRSSMPGVPWGGVQRRMAQIEAQQLQARAPLDYVFMGHWHSPQALAGINSRVWINSSVKGLDEYSLANFGQGHKAEQTLLTFHPDRGYSGSYPLTLQDLVPAGEGW